jgi:hypothetical protein
MKKNWPYFIVASFLNTLLVTATFIELKLRGISVFEMPATAAGFPAWYDISPVQFAGGMFVLSFLIILTIIGIKLLMTGIFTRLHLFNQSLANSQNQLAMDNPSLRVNRQ